MGQPSMASGDIMLFYHPRGVARLISFFTRSPYYHVAIAENPNELIEAVPRGVVRTSLASKGKARFVIVSSPGKEPAKAALHWAESKVGDGYDPSDLLAIALDRIFTQVHVNLVHGDRFTCGEFIATAFKETGVVLFPDLDLEDVVSADFARLLPKGNIAKETKSSGTRVTVSHQRE